MSDASLAGALQFDAAEPLSGPAAAACARCARNIQNVYHQVDGQVVCSPCRATAESDASGQGDLGMGAVYGLGAAVAGGLIYFVVLHFLNLQIGLVAILVGWMVGRAVSRGAGGRGNVALQVLAVALTYAAVAGAYAGEILTNPLARVLIGGVTGAFVMGLKLPFMGFDPIGWLIIGFGLFQAWTLAAPRAAPAISGPYTLQPKPAAE